MSNDSPTSDEPIEVVVTMTEAIYSTLVQRAAESSRTLSELVTMWLTSYRETHDVLKKLVVRPDDFPGRLLVDCSAVVEDKNDIELWALESQSDGSWAHWPSGEEGALYDCLLGIAACYTPTMQAKGRAARAQFKAEMAAEASASKEPK